jgi:glycosyltransferase involved in cell wall biosynthesis
MKIAYLTADHGVPVYGTKGASIHVNSIASEMSSLGHEVLVLTPNPGQIPLEQQKFLVQEVVLDRDWETISQVLKEEELSRDGNRLSKDIRNLVYNVLLKERGIAILDKFEPEMIYERYSLFGTAGSLLASHYGIPLILEVNAPLLEEQQQQRGLSLPKVAKETQQMVFKRANHLIVVSSWLKDYLVSHGVNENKITILPNGVDTHQFFPRMNPELKKKLGWENMFVVGYVGTMKDWHGLPSVIEALSLARKKKQNIRLLLVGEGPELSVLKRRIEELDLKEYVYLTGLVPHPQVPDWISIMDVALVPFDVSVSEYFSPVKMFEYMAMERPVLAARIAQTAEIIEPGLTGWLYVPGDSLDLSNKVLWMEENKDKIYEAGKAAGRKVQKYTWKQNAICAIEIAMTSLKPNLRSLNNS